MPWPRHFERGNIVRWLVGRSGYQVVRWSGLSGWWVVGREGLTIPAHSFAPAVEEGPRKEANFLVAFDADSEMVGPSAGFGVEPASGDDAPKVKGDVAPPVDPNPEKPPNLCGAAGCW